MRSASCRQSWRRKSRPRRGWAQPRRKRPSLRPQRLPPEADKPGTERWPVKTGQDQDRAKVGKNIINGQNLGAGIVESTIAELITLPRPPGLQVATQNPPQFQSVRDGVTEVTIWRIDVVIIGLTHESDGDYHLVLQGPGGETMVGEIPTPTAVFVGDSPWLANIQQARQEVDQKLVKNLSPQSFALVNDNCGHRLLRCARHSSVALACVSVDALDRSPALYTYCSFVLQNSHIRVGKLFGVKTSWL